MITLFTLIQAYILQGGPLAFKYSDEQTKEPTHVCTYNLIRYSGHVEIPIFIPM